MYLLEVHDGLFNEPFQVGANPHQGWTLITPCTGNLKNIDFLGNKVERALNDVVLICPLLLESEEFTDEEHHQFMLLIGMITKTAQCGHDWPRVLNKAVHLVGDINVRRVNGKHESHPVMQFGKKKTLIRMHAFTGSTGRKLAFISHVFVKPKNSDKTPESEKSRSKNNLQAFLNAVDNGTAQFIDLQGGRNGFLKLV